MYKRLIIALTTSLTAAACADDAATDTPTESACRTLQNNASLAVTATDDEVGAPGLARLTHYVVTLPAVQGSHAGSVIYDVGTRDIGPYHLLVDKLVGVTVTTKAGAVVPVTQRTAAATGCTAALSAFDFDLSTGDTARIDITPVDPAVASVGAVIVSDAP